MSELATLTRSELTAEEKARRARIHELRDQIKVEAGERRVIKTAYRLPHGSDEHKAAMKQARIDLKIDCRFLGSWNEHAIPCRDYGRAFITELHVELAKLRGKQHLVRKID